jgi:hypothetical protein
MTDNPQTTARAAGVLYLVIIVFGLWSELAVRGGLVVPGDAAATAENILANETLFRLGFAADSVMALSDAALAILLFVLLRPVNAMLALMAAAFRLLQTAVIGVNLLNQYAALLILGDAGTTTALGSDQAEALALFFLDAQSHGYDLGLIFFGVNSLLTGWLVWRAAFLPRALGALLIVAGVVYLTGSYLLFLSPSAYEVFQPAYALCLLGELAFCLWLLVRGVEAARWREA